MSDQLVKKAVRERDGQQCSECGMTAADHRARYGSTLDVHRTTPGSPYTQAGCVALCRPCHAARHGADAGLAVALYDDGRGLTMQQVADRLGVSKARVHQMLKAAGARTDHRHRRTGPRSPDQGGKKYRAYEMTRETRILIDLLSGALGRSRAKVVTQAVVELGDRTLPGWRDKVAAAAAGQGQGADPTRPGHEAEAGATRRRRKAATPHGLADADAAGQAGAAGKPRRKGGA